MTEEDLLALQVQTARDSLAYHQEQADAERAQLPGIPLDTPQHDTCLGQIDYHSRQAKRWADRLAQLGAKV